MAYVRLGTEAEILMGRSNTHMGLDRADGRRPFQNLSV